MACGIRHLCELKCKSRKKHRNCPRNRHVGPALGSKRQLSKKKDQHGDPGAVDHQPRPTSLINFQCKCSVPSFPSANFDQKCSCFRFAVQVSNEISHALTRGTPLPEITQFSEGSCWLCSWPLPHCARKEQIRTRHRQISSRGRPIFISSFFRLCVFMFSFFGSF